MDIITLPDVEMVILFFCLFYFSLHHPHSQLWNAMEFRTASFIHTHQQSLSHVFLHPLQLCYLRISLFYISF